MTPLRIAFVSSHPSMRRYRRDASYIYRCENLALALTELGHQVSLTHLNVLLLRRDFDIAVFLRPAQSLLFDYVVERMRKRGTLLIGDADDLIFDPTCAAFRPSVRNNLSDEVRTQEKFISHASAMKKMDKLQFSTDDLVRRYKALNPYADCAVIPNAGFRLWRDIPTAAICAKPNISYFSGTRTHDRDLALVRPILEKLLERHRNLTIRIVGPVTDTLHHPRAVKIAKVSFTEYPHLVKNSHISIAPLEDTPFNQCKSALKALEAGMMNVPTVVSSIGDYSNVRLDGVLHANSAQEWESQLEYALVPTNYERMREGLRERMQEFSDIDAVAENFLAFANSRDLAAA